MATNQISTLVITISVLSSLIECFFQTLTLKAEKRITLAALYLGTGDLEAKFVQNLRLAVAKNPGKLQLTGKFIYIVRVSAVFVNVASNVNALYNWYCKQ